MPTRVVDPSAGLASSMVGGTGLEPSTSQLYFSTGADVAGLVDRPDRESVRAVDVVDFSDGQVAVT